MASNLVIVESPSKAKTIEKYLGKDYEVIASVGHLRDLPEKTFGVNIENNFEPKYQIMPAKKELVKKLVKMAKEADNVYLATDPDREGEAISWHISQLLKMDEDKKCRVTFNEITKNAVLNGIKHPRTIDISLVDAQQARRILDRIVGYKLSPLLWKKIRKGLSAGRVQSVAVKMICDREDEINNFVPQEYWTLDAMFKAGNSEFSAKFYGINGKKAQLNDKKSTDDVLSDLKTADFIVSDVKKTEKKRYPVPPFTTSTLQQAASRSLNFSSKKTMMVAQTLYEGVDIAGIGSTGLITYMRTDSLRISAEAIDAAKKYITENIGEEYYPEKPNVFKKKSENTQDAHEAVRPSNIELTPDKIKSSLTNDQYKLYRLIWNRFVSSQLKPAVYDVLTIEIEGKGKKNINNFRTVCQNLKFDGCTKFYIDADDEEEKKSKVPKVSKDDKLELSELLPKQNFTGPPLRYTEASLVKAMEENGIGRPSTYAPTISTILAREYVKKEGKSFVPTNLGTLVTNLMKASFSSIVDEKFTAQMEHELDTIESDGKDWHKVLSDFYGDFSKTLEEANENAPKMQETTDEKCELCGANLIIKSGRFGKFLACPNYPECKFTRPMPKVTLSVPCPKCGGTLVEKTSKNKKVFYGCTNYPTCDFASWDKPLDKKCELCGSYMVERRFGRSKKEYCSNPDCKNCAPKPKPKAEKAEKAEKTTKTTRKTTKKS